MRRNLLNRVETVFPIIDPIDQKRIQRILFTSLLDNDGAWELMRDGSYQKRVPQGETINSQQIFTQSSYGITSDKLRHMMDAKP
jgi:polyphosphate kinase